MKRKFFLLLLFFVTACGSTPQAVATSSKEVVPTSPPATPTLASPTSIPITPTIAREPVSFIGTTDPNFFRDDFQGALDTQWSWLREDPLNWSLVNIPGSLQINVEGGSVPAHSNSNLLLRSAPTGNFQIETKITFIPTDNFQFAGLIIYESDSDFIQAGREYCSAVGCVGDGLYLDSYKGGVAVKPSTGHAYSESDTIWIRLSRRGNSYTFGASTDDRVWFSMGTYPSDINPLQIGLVAGQAQGDKVLPALFDYFEVRILP
ncbi:MAG: beta-xylosidase family glycoside hydrolase [Anaerolineales bacterium]